MSVQRMHVEPVEVEPDEDEPMSMEWSRVTLSGDDDGDVQQPGTPGHAQPATSRWNWSRGRRSQEPSPTLFMPQSEQQRPWRWHLDPPPRQPQLQQQPEQQQGAHPGNLQPTSLALDDLLLGLTW